MRDIDLSGKIAVVTGAGSGIGRATARLLARHGARVHVADINAESANGVTAEIESAGGSAVAHAIDVADPDAVEALSQSVFDTDRRVDILHNNAGIGHAGNIEATTMEDWQRVININLLGVAYGMQAFVPRMLAQGRPATVLNTASEAGLVPTALMAPYTASKFGVVGMSEALNAELAPGDPRDRRLSGGHQYCDRSHRNHPRRGRCGSREGDRVLWQARSLA